MKRTLLALALGVAFGAAHAAPSFSLTNIPAGWDGSYEIKFANYESFTNGLTVDSMNFGTLKITSIVDPGSGNTLWTDSQGGAELTGVFNGITVQSVTPTGGGHVGIDSTGGLMSVFINAAGSFGGVGGFMQGMGGYGAAGCAIGTLCYNGISNVAGGGSFLDLAWTGGVHSTSGDYTTTVSGDFVSGTLPTSGKAEGYLNVTGGTYAAMFDTNGWVFANGSKADLFAQNDFCTPGQTGCVSLASAGGSPTAGGWQLRSNDPVRGFIPEPASLALMGLGLAALGATVRRKQNAG